MECYESLKSYKIERMDGWDFGPGAVSKSQLSSSLEIFGLQLPHPSEELAGI